MAAKKLKVIHYADVATMLLVNVQRFEKVLSMHSTHQELRSNYKGKIVCIICKILW